MRCSAIYLFIFAAVSLSCCASAAVPRIGLTSLSVSAPEGYVELRGVRAGAFDPEMWSESAPVLLPDLRHPVLEPKQGAARNIYAPSAVQVPGGWRLFYGAWDGVPTGNDRIYSAFTPDFVTFSARHTVIEHGPFIHVCNVNALRLDKGSFAMICTAYPDASDLNKPVFFTSPDGRSWNGSPEPYTASHSDIIDIRSYDKYAGADINGMNVILHENGAYRLYFGNFRDFGKVYTATSNDGKAYDFGGVALEGAYAVNDVKRFSLPGDTRYLMGVHMNTDKMWYSLSSNAAQFNPVKPLLQNIDSADRYIVALGWVTDGKQEQPDRKLLGVLYGAGASPGLAENRIFARWLQKQAVFVADDGRRINPTRAIGPDRQLIPVSTATSGVFEFYSEDGKTMIGRSQRVTIEPGASFGVKFSR